MINIVYSKTNDEKMIREAFASAISKLMHDNSNVVYLDSDLMSASGMTGVKKEYPDQVYNCGVAEANMIGIACGMAAVGKIPFVHSFGTFASRRCYDQLFLSAGYAKNSIRVLGTDEGIAAEYNGGTHMPFEDMSLLRAIPSSCVINITDVAMMRNLVAKLAAREGLTYIRTTRKTPKKIYSDDSDFTIGKGVVVRDGTDVTIIACGLMVSVAIDAADELAKQGISAAVIDMFTIKPLDCELVEKYAKKTGAVVTAENHNVIGGLGSAVAEHLVASIPVPMEFIGVHESFGEVGTMDYLAEKFNLTVGDIVEKVKKAISRK